MPHKYRRPVSPLHVRLHSQLLRERSLQALVERLVAEFVRRGWRVATIKHAHHDADVDQPGTNSFRHRAAGATEVALVGGHRSIMREQEEPTLAEVFARLAPADLVLIEGFKRERHAKIEVRSGEGDKNAPPMAPKDPSIVAVAADQPPGRSAPAVVPTRRYRGPCQLHRQRRSALTGEDARRLVVGTVVPDREHAGLIGWRTARSIGRRGEESAAQAA